MISDPVNRVVEDAVEEFNRPGRYCGNAPICIKRSIRTYREDIEPGFEFTESDIGEIHHRFKEAISYPPPIAAADLANLSHTDPGIDPAWFERIDEFPRWAKVREDWGIGRSGDRLPATAIDNIGITSDHILGHSPDPRSAESYLWKGLVVGNVQSGKTANYIGLISKAIDVGYRVIVVLSGRLKSLRYQTQIRVNEKICGEHGSSSYDSRIIGLTAADLNGDFGEKHKNWPQKPLSDKLRREPDSVIVMVMKKHFSPLQKFSDWVREIGEYYPDFHRFPMLMIDDEMDEAGPNTGGEGDGEVDESEYPEQDTAGSRDEGLGKENSDGTSNTDEDDDGVFRDEPSTTNQAITNLLREESFSRRMYLGFTATPYAVVLHRRREIESPTYKKFGPDIFPSDYLLVLPDSDNYCGGDLFLGRAETIVREMNVSGDGKMGFGDQTLYLPECFGLEEVVETIPASECCPNCANQRNENGRKTHGESGSRSHCAAVAPGKYWPIDRLCGCECHARDEVHRLVPQYPYIVSDQNHDDTFQYAEMIPSLHQALLDFVLAAAARMERGDGKKPCTMMVNAHHRSLVHVDLKFLIHNWFEDHHQLFSANMQSRFLNDLRDRWEKSFVPLIHAFNGKGEPGPENFVLHGGGDSTESPDRIIAFQEGSAQSRPPRTTSFEDIVRFVPDFIRELSYEHNHRVLNNIENDEIDYSSEPSLKCVVHGGHNLGRGLTFKGLVTSYIVRGHGDLSGLMQMQRWCGYRGESGERILDLMRIYITHEDQELFHRLLAIEKKNRFLLKAYMRQNKSPVEYATVIEQDKYTPLMSAAKQGALKNVGRILSGSQRTQRTFRFEKSEDDDVLANITFLAGWLDKILEFRFEDHSRQGLIYRDVPACSVTELVENWQMEDSPRFQKNDVLQWIRRLSDWAKKNPDRPQLSKWSIFIPSRNKEIPLKVDGDHVDGFNPLDPIGIGEMKIYPYPYKLDGFSENRLKTIQSPGYERIDIDCFFDGRPRPERHGHLLISPIIHPLNRNIPGGDRKRTSADIVGSNTENKHPPGKWPNLLGLGFWFPTTDALDTELVIHSDSTGVD